MTYNQHFSVISPQQPFNQPLKSQDHQQYLTFHSNKSKKRLKSKSRKNYGLLSMNNFAGTQKMLRSSYGTDKENKTPYFNSTDQNFFQRPQQINNHTQKYENRLINTVRSQYYPLRVSTMKTKLGKREPSIDSQTSDGVCWQKKKLLKNINIHCVSGSNSRDKIHNGVNSLPNGKGKQRIQLSQFQLGLCRNQDSIGKIYPARHLSLGFLCCIKQIHKRQADGDADRIIRYFKIQMSSTRKQMLGIYGIFDDSENIYLIMQYHQESFLNNSITINKKIPEKAGLNCILQLAKAIAPLESKSIKFGQITAASIVSVTVQGVWKLSGLTYFAKPTHKLTRSTSKLKGIQNKRQKISQIKQIQQLTNLLEQLVIGPKYLRKDNYNTETLAKGDLEKLSKIISYNNVGTLSQFIKVIKQLLKDE